MSEKTGFAARSFLMPCRHSGRSLASPVTKAKPNAVVLLWRGGTAEQVSFRIHPEANAAKLVPARSHFLRAAACPRRENRKQDVSCRPACTKKSRLPAALHAVSIAHRSVPFHAILRMETGKYIDLFEILSHSSIQDKSLLLYSRKVSSTLQRT